MKRILTVLLCLPAASCSVSLDWPSGMKPETYTGRVVGKSNHRPLAGATVELKRPGKKLSKSMLGDWAAVSTPQTIGTGTSLSDGSFSITTTSGYATSAYVYHGDRFGSEGSADQNSRYTKPLPHQVTIELEESSR